MKPLFIINKTTNPDPSYATLGSSGLDLYADEDYIIPTQYMGMIGTGVHVQIPEGYEGQLRSRSGFSTKNQCILINGVGTIDSDYRGEIKVPLYNMNDSKAIFINKGDRIAQLVITPYEKVEVVRVDNLEDTDRGNGGFGSSGK